MDPNFFEKIRYLIDVERYEMAIDEIRKLAADYPDFEALHYFLALCHFHLDEYRDATECIEQAITLEPNDSQNHVLRSQIMLMRNRHADTSEAAENAVILDPENASAHVALAQARQHQKKYQAALESTDAALALDPANQTALAIRAQIQRALGQHDAAAATTQALLAEAPNDAMSMFTKAETSLVEGNFEGALAHYREALRIDPTFKAARDGAAQAVMTKYALFRGAMRILLWIYKLPPMVRNALIAACIGVFLYTPPDPRLALFWLGLRMVILVASIFTMLANPLMTAAMMSTREGRRVLPPESKRAAMWTVASVGSCLALTIAWAVFAIEGFFTAGVYGFAAILTATSIEEAHPSWPRKSLVGMTAVSIIAMILTAVFANSFDPALIDALADSSLKAPDLPATTRFRLIAFFLLSSGRTIWLVAALLASLFLDEVVVKE